MALQAILIFVAEKKSCTNKELNYELWMKEVIYIISDKKLNAIITEGFLNTPCEKVGLISKCGNKFDAN